MMDIDLINTLQAAAQLLNLSGVTQFEDLGDLSDLVPPSDYDTYTACYGFFMTPGVTRSHRVYLFLCVLFVLVGLIGNALSVVVFASRDMRLISSNFYLLILAISDSMYLICVMCSRMTTSLRCLYIPSSHIDIFNRSTLMCKLLQFLLDLMSDYSTCLIMAFTIERYIAVYRPLQFKEVCTVRKARIVCATLFISTAIFIAPHHFLYIGRPQGLDVCTVLPDYETELTVLYIAESTVFRIVPIISIVVFNVLIITRVTQLTRSARNTTRIPSERSRIQRRSKNMQLTVILVLVSSTYISAIMPTLIHFVIWKMERSGLLTASDASMMISQNYTRILYVMAFAINFFLYTLSGGIFREQLYHLLCKFKFKPVKVDATEMMTLV